MKIEDIRNNPAIMMHLRWDLTMEKLICSKEDFSSKDAGFYFGIYAWGDYNLDIKARLVLIHLYPDGTYIQQPIEEIPRDMICVATGGVTGIINSGNKINKTRESNVRNGRYFTINKPIMMFLKDRINVNSNKKEK